MLRIKRVYDPPSRDDGIRILVDRLWPRGLRKQEALVHEWKKDLAPSSTLRKWFAHDPAKWDEFRKRYFAELSLKSDAINELAEITFTNKVTLLYSSREDEFNNAVALKMYLEERTGRRRVKKAA